MTKYVSFRDGGKTDEKGISRYLNKMLDGEVFTGLAVSQQSPVAMGITVSAGDCMIESGNDYPYIGWNDADFNVTISTADGSNPRYDLIVAYIDLTVVSTATPNNPGALLIAKVNGTPAGSPVVPNSVAIHAIIGASNPYIVLGRVLVGAGVVSITNANILDMRVMASLAINTAETAAGGWVSSSILPTSITYNGNGSHTLVYPSSIKAFKSAGMRNKYVRTVTAPIQCVDLESGSSQYYSKTTPAGLSFTTTYTTMGWIKLESYGAVMGIIARRNADTEGWSFIIQADGRLNLTSLRIAANNKQTNSYQSVPLARWVHVAASMNVSVAGDASTVMYIDGVVVPSTTTTNGTCTALVQGTTALVVGADRSAGANYFDGKLAQVAVFSAVLSASTIRSYISQGLSGSETNIASAYSFNNSINDLNATNANNLTANNGPVATNSDTPFTNPVTNTSLTAGTINYSITTNVSSDGLTETVQIPEGETLPSSGGITSTFYSIQESPYGFITQKNKWQIISLINASETVTIGGVNAWYVSVGGKLTVPIGEWDVGYSGAFQANSTVSAVRDCHIAFESSAPTNNSRIQRRTSQLTYTGVASADVLGTLTRMAPESLAAQTSFLLYGDITAASGTETWKIRGDVGPVALTANFNYI